jgi:phage baseplate assembly protein W
MAQDFHGRGWAFPVSVGPGGGIALAEGEEDIRQSVRIIVGTALGERQMRPDFGCPAHELAFDPTDASLTGKARFYVRNALERWEPRIEVERVEARIEGLKLLVEIEYTVRRTNRRDNVVFPYYLQGERQGVRT